VQTAVLSELRLNQMASGKRSQEVRRTLDGGYEIIEAPELIQLSAIGHRPSAFSHQLSAHRF
jgi:hypothetical protein